MLERLLKVRTQSMAAPGDVSLALIAVESANCIQDVTSKTAKVFRDAIDQQPMLCKSPLYRLASRIFEISEVTSAHSTSVRHSVWDKAGEETVETLLRTLTEQTAPLTWSLDGCRCGVRSRTYRLAYTTDYHAFYIGTGTLSDRTKMAGELPLVPSQASLGFRPAHSHDLGWKTIDVASAIPGSA